MSKTTISPLASLKPQIPDVVGNVSQAVKDILQAGFFDLLEQQGVKPNGTAQQTVRDPNWDKDINYLVERVEEHTVFHVNDAGLFIPTVVSVKLDTLKMEVDGNDEVCCWIYEES